MDPHQDLFEYVGSAVAVMTRIAELEKTRLRHGYKRVQLA